MCTLEGSLCRAAGKAFLEKVEFQPSFKGKVVPRHEEDEEYSREDGGWSKRQKRCRQCCWDE